MAEERIIRSPTSVGDESREEKKVELAKDRKSLTGMSEKVKATLAPLLGGIKHHPEVEVDLGRESGAATYETVPMGSTPMSRYSTVAESSPGNPSLVDKVKDTITGQVPGRGTYSGKATSDSSPNPNPDRLPTDHLPVQDVGLGSGKHGSSMPGHKPNEDNYVLDGHTDPVPRFRSTTPTSEGENPFNG